MVAIVVLLLIGGIVKAFAPASPVKEAAVMPPAPPAVISDAVDMDPYNPAAQPETNPEVAYAHVSEDTPFGFAESNASIANSGAAGAALNAEPHSESAAGVAPSVITLRTKPKVGRQFKMPEYPAASRRAGEAGDVTVSACVDIEGRLSTVRLVKSSGYARLDDATISNLPKSRLEPAIGSDGKPMAMCDPPYVMTIVWTLSN